jgi:hypothetical protein
LKGLPSEAILKTLYKYGQNYATEWAKDAVLTNLVYYVESTEKESTKTAQFFIESAKRGDRLMSYVPKMSDRIEEVQKTDSYLPQVMPKIQSFSRWKSNLKDIIERQSSDIAKSDKVRLQISPSRNELAVNFYYEKKNRTWIQRDEIKK